MENYNKVDVDINRYVEDQISTNFHVILRTFFDVISMVEKSTLFPRPFFDVISMYEKSTLFPLPFFDVISLVEISTVFLTTFFYVTLMVEKSTLFARTFFDKIPMNSPSFLVSCELMKTFEGVFLC